MLGNSSAIATLILFVIYFVGRAITISIEKNLCYDKIAFEDPDEIYGKYDIVEEVDTNNEDEISSEYPSVVVLTSVQGIWNINVYEIAYDDELNEKKKGHKRIASYDFLNIGQSYAIKTFIPELIPRYRIEYCTQDMKKVTFDISENLKNGVPSEMMVPKHTIKSFIYYLFR